MRSHHASSECPGSTCLAKTPTKPKLYFPTSCSTGRSCLGARRKALRPRLARSRAFVPRLRPEIRTGAPAILPLLNPTAQNPVPPASENAVPGTRSSPVRCPQKRCAAFQVRFQVHLGSHGEPSGHRAPLLQAAGSRCEPPPPPPTHTHTHTQTDLTSTFGPPSCAIICPSDGSTLEATSQPGPGSDRCAIRCLLVGPLCPPSLRHPLPPWGPLCPRGRVGGGGRAIRGGAGWSGSDGGGRGKTNRRGDGSGRTLGPIAPEVADWDRGDPAEGSDAADPALPAPMLLLTCPSRPELLQGPDAAATPFGIAGRPPLA